MGLGGLVTVDPSVRRLKRPVACRRNPNPRRGAIAVFTPAYCDLNFHLPIWYNNADSENCDYHEIRNYED